MSIDGMDELERKMRSLSKLNVKRETARTIQTVRDAAVNACPVGYGELRQSIFAEVIEKDDLVQGVCYTNKDYSIYVEFGTGPKGQENHAGTSPEHNPVYTQQPWWIHESQVDARIAEKYHWFHIDTPEGRFLNPGHSMETAWFMMKEAIIKKDNELMELAIQVTEWSLQRGWDKEKEGIFYFADLNDKPVLSLEWEMKLFWVHCEAMIALIYS